MMPRFRWFVAPANAGQVEAGPDKVEIEAFGRTKSKALLCGRTDICGRLLAAWSDAGFASASTCNLQPLTDLSALRAYPTCGPPASRLRSPPPVSALRPPTSDLWHLASGLWIMPPASDLWLLASGLWSLALSASRLALSAPTSDFWPPVSAGASGSVGSLTPSARLRQPASRPVESVRFRLSVRATRRSRGRPLRDAGSGAADTAARRPP